MTQRKAPTGLTKLIFPLAPGAWHGFETERVWVEPLGESRYRIRNVPFYAKGVSAEDIVRADNTPRGEEYARVVLRGGHSTYRIFMSEASDVEGEPFKRCWAGLEAQGCTHERATARLLAVDVPPNADIHEVYAALQRGEEEAVWEFEEGHCGHI